MPSQQTILAIKSRQTASFKLGLWDIDVMPSGGREKRGSLQEPLGRPCLRKSIPENCPGDRS